MNYVPRQAVWELTLTCNMSCLHCGSRAGKSRNNELTLDECLDIAQQLIDLGLEYITLIGGEIFTHKDWHIIARKFVDAGVSTNIITNAYLMGDRQLEQLKKSGIEMVGISLDGMEETHNKIRGKKDSFQRVDYALTKLKQEGFKTSIITTVLDMNVDELEDMYKFIEAHDVYAWQIQLANPMGNASDHVEFLIDPKRVPGIIKFIREKKELGKVRVIPGDCVGYFDENEEAIRGYNKVNAPFSGCGAGLCVIGLDSVGNVKGCESLYDDKFIEGNLRNESLKKIWTKEGNFAYNRGFTPDKVTGHCAGCDKASVCAGGCRSMSYFTTGNYYDNPYCCYRLSKNC